MSKAHASPRPEPPAAFESSWRAGDLAECHFAGPWRVLNDAGRAVQPGPAHGEVRVVERVWASSLQLDDGSPVVTLQFARYPGRRYLARYFARLTPRHDALTPAGDRQFVARLRRSPPRRATLRAVLVHLVLPPALIVIACASWAFLLWAWFGGAQ